MSEENPNSVSLELASVPAEEDAIGSGAGADQQEEDYVSAVAAANDSKDDEAITLAKILVLHAEEVCQPPALEPVVTVEMEVEIENENQTINNQDLIENPSSNDDAVVGKVEAEQAEANDITITPLPAQVQEDDDGNSSTAASPSRTAEDLEGIRKLEIRLSRIPDSASSSPSKTPVSVSKRKLPLKKKKIPLKQHKGLAPSQRRFTMFSRKRVGVGVMKQKKPSVSIHLNQVKIKMNFLNTKKQKGDVPVGAGKRTNSKPDEIDFETKEREAAAEASSRKLETRPTPHTVSLISKKMESRFKKRATPPPCPESSNSSDEDKDDSSWIDEYGVRPMRAAAERCLEAVVQKRKDTDDPDSKLFRSKYLTKPSNPKGKGRRSKMKRALVQRGILHCAEDELGFRMLESLFHNDVYFQIGDIIGVHSNVGEEEKTSETYFAQIIYMMDYRNEHLVEAVWLTPNTRCASFPFYPKNYNRRDDFPTLNTTIEHCQFVMHLPYDYYTNPLSFSTVAPFKVYQRLNEPLVVDDALKVEVKLNEKEEQNEDEEIKEEKQESRGSINCNAEPNLASVDS